MTTPRVVDASASRHPGAAGLALLGLFLSGAAGLVAEICWIRRSSLIFGSTTHALSTVLTVFFLGLALGSWVFGRVAMRARNPLRTCALLEAGIATLIVATIPAFGVVEDVYGTIYRAATTDPARHADSPALWAARALLVGVILLPPTFLMGGTLPLFARRFVRDPRRVGDAIARLYGLNTLGAVVGCVATGFVLLHGIGIMATLMVAASLNLIAAACMARARGADLEPVAPPTPAAAARSLPVSRAVGWTVGVLVFVAGFVALAQEVLWTRYLALVVKTSVHTYTTTLAVVLVGIVLGSWLIARLADRSSRRAWLFGALQVANGLVVWGLLMQPPAWWRSLGGELPVAAALLLPSAILSGASFPLAVRMVVAQPAWAAIGTGTMIAVNTLGGIAGSVAAGFWMLPVWGLEWGARICTALSLAAGIAAWLWLDRGGARLRSVGHAGLATLAVGAWLALPGLTGTRLPADFLADRERLVDWREGLEANLAVVRRPTGTLVLEMDRWWQGQDRKTHQVMAAHLPLMLHPAPRRALLVGVGAGQAPSRLAMHDLERIDCVDIEPRVFDLDRAHFESGWMSDPRVRLLRMDGRNHITHTAERYDVISLEVGQLFRPGVASFYTLDFYLRARDRLAPGGLLAQFVPLPFLAEDDLRGVVATFRRAFPAATLWYNTSELLLIGSTGDAPVLRRERLAQVMSDSTIAADLRFSPWGGPAEWLSRPEVLLGGFLCGPRGLEELGAGGRVDRDDRPVLEAAAARLRGSEMREIETLPLLRRCLDPIEAGAPGTPPEVARAATTLRERNLDDIVAAAHVRAVDGAMERKDYPGVVAALDRALRANPGSVNANRLMGDVQFVLANAPEGERYFRQALAISPGDAGARSGLGLLCLTQGRLAEAVEHYRVAITDEPRNSELWNNLGAALGQMGDLEGATRHFEQALALRPGYADALRNLERTREAQNARRSQPERPATGSDSVAHGPQL